MMINSTLEIDRQHGTTDLARAVEHTADGKTIPYDGIARMLVWHCPQFQQFQAVSSVLRPVAEQHRAFAVRVVGITPNVFALGLYSKAVDTSGNPQAIVLLEVSGEGSVLGAEHWQPNAGPLSRIFDEHKNDTHPVGWLQPVADQWRRTSLLPAEGQQASPRPLAHELRRPRAVPAPTPAPQPRPARQGARRERAKINKQLRGDR